MEEQKQENYITDAAAVVEISKTREDLTPQNREPCEMISNFSMQFYYTYVLHSLKDRKNYLGYTENLKLRFEQHKKGLVESTKHRRPFKLIYYEACLNQEDALKREKYFKTHYGKMFLKKRLAKWFSQSE